MAYRLGPAWPQFALMLIILHLCYIGLALSFCNVASSKWQTLVVCLIQMRFLQTKMNHRKAQRITSSKTTVPSIINAISTKPWYFLTQYRNEYFEYPCSSTPVPFARPPYSPQFYSQRPSTLIQPISGPMQSSPLQPSFFEQYGDRLGKEQRHSPAFAVEQRNSPNPVNFASHSSDKDEGDGNDGDKGRNKWSAEQTDTLVASWRECFIQLEL